MSPGEELAPAQSRPRWLSSWFYSRADHAITLLLLATLAISTFAIRKGPAVVEHFNFLDGSWALDIAFNSRHGVWLGKDITFTYGPLFEWMLGSCVWLHQWSVGTFFKYGDWLGWSCAIVATWALSLLLLRGQPVWKRVFYIFCIVVFWMYWNVRPVIDVLLFAVSVWECDRLRSATARPLRGLSIALLITLAFLVSSETGAYSLAAFVIVSLSFLYCYRSDPAYARRVLRLVFWTSAGAVAWTFLIGVALTRSVGIEFWKTNIANLETYRWTMSVPMTRDLNSRFYCLLVGILGVITLGWIWRDSRSRSLARHPAYLVSATLFSLFMLESALVRADKWHLVFGFFPGILLSGAVLMGADTDSRGGLWEYAPVLVALVLTAVFSPAPNPMFVPRELAQHVAAYRMPAKQACPPATSYWDDACLPDSDYRRIQSVANYLKVHSAPSDWIAVFPYENVYGVAANRRVGGGVLQSYQAAGNYLVARHISGLEKEKPPLAVYSADSVASGAIDLVPNLTRSPETWLYLQSLYETAAAFQPGVLVLRRKPARQQRWKIQATDLPLAMGARSALLPKRGLGLAERLFWPADADLVKLSLVVRYPLWWHVLKPTHVVVGLGFADGTEKNTLVVIAPNRQSTIWIYPWRDSDLQNYFSADESAWRAAGSRTPVTKLWITMDRRDLFSVNPTSIRVDGLQAVKLSLAPPR